MHVLLTSEGLVHRHSAGGCSMLLLSGLMGLGTRLKRAVNNSLKRSHLNDILVSVYFVENVEGDDSLAAAEQLSLDQVA